MLEDSYFKKLDTAGAHALRKLSEEGPSSLSSAERQDFVSLLLSLDFRRPDIIHRLRGTGANALAEALNSDAEIKAAAKAGGLKELPSVYYEKQSGISFEDRSLSLVKRLTTQAASGERILKTGWRVVRLGEYDGNFVLSDRPLIRIGNTFSERFVWAMPLSPKVAFWAAKWQRDAETIGKLAPTRFARELNYSSVNQADKYAFAVEARERLEWLSGRLKSRFAAMQATHSEARDDHGNRSD